MKKALVNTRVSVKLRKSEYRDEWYLYRNSHKCIQRSTLIEIFIK